MKHLLILLAILVSLGVQLRADQPKEKDSKDSDKFWTKTRISLTVIHAGTASFDLYTTRRGLAHGFHERNPFLRHLIHRGGWGQAGAVGFSLGLDLGLSYLVHRVTKQGSPWRILKWELPIVLSSVHTIAGVYNYHLVSHHLNK